MQAAIAAERDSLLTGAALERADGTAEQVAVLVGEVAVGNPADVVFADDLGI